MNTPIYREMDRLFNNNMTVCRNTVYNWFVKGSAHLKKVLPILKQIQQERQGEKTSRIIQRLRHRLDKLLVDTRGMRGNLMQKALNYLNSFWNQLILYLKDGRYSIDCSSFARLLPAGRKNSLAERSLRTLTVERKRSALLATIGTQEHVTDDHRYKKK